MSGFVRLERGAFDHPILRDPLRFRAWFWLVANACWKPSRYDVNGKIIDLQRGQVCASLRQLAEAWGMSKTATERFITRLKTETMIGTDTGTGRYIITICNYDKYNPCAEMNGTATGTPSGTTAGQQRDIKEQGNKETTVVVAIATRASDDAPGLKPVHVFEKWNEVAKRVGKATVRDLTPSRQQLVRARIGQYSLEDFVVVFGKVEGSNFLREGRFCTFDWIMKRANFQKIIEGNYDDEPVRQIRQAGRSAFIH